MAVTGGIGVALFLAGMAVARWPKRTADPAALSAHAAEPRSPPTVSPVAALGIPDAAATAEPQPEVSATTLASATTTPPVTSPATAQAGTMSSAPSATASGRHVAHGPSGHAAPQATAAPRAAYDKRD